MLKESKREVGEFNASSMADITFLLLIFFLVTTTISSDKGLTFVLPPIADASEGVKVKGVVNIFLNDEDNVLLGKKGHEEEVNIQLVRDRLQILKREIAAEGNNIVVSIKTTEGSTYSKYIDILDQVKSAEITRISLAQ